MGVKGQEPVFALTAGATEISGIPYVMDADAAEVEKILGYRR